MNEFLILVLFGVIMLIGNLCGGYRLDEQLFYPHDNKHSMRVPKKFRRFIFLNKIECLRAAFIIEIIGYFEFFAMLIFAVVCAILNYTPPGNTLSLIFVILLWFDTLNILLVSFYYKIKYRHAKNKSEKPQVPRRR